jgi:hypothetical protein
MGQPISPTKAAAIRRRRTILRGVAVTSFLGMFVAAWAFTRPPELAAVVSPVDLPVALDSHSEDLVWLRAMQIYVRTGQRWQMLSKERPARSRELRRAKRELDEAEAVLEAVSRRRAELRQAEEAAKPQSL